MSKGAGVSPFGKECADLFWPQTRASSDDICISCGNLRYQGHDPECAFMRYTRLIEALEDIAAAASAPPCSACNGTGRGEVVGR